MKPLLHLAFILPAILTLRASEPEAEDHKAEDAVNDWAGPWSDPEFFDPPDADTISRWKCILRYTETTHAKTPLVFDWYGRDDLVRIVVRRISDGKIDLKYTLDIEMDLAPSWLPPDWAMTLPENDNAQGLDGTSTSIQLFSGETTRTMHRWSPTLNEDERGLKELNVWVASMKRVTGIHARSLRGEGHEKRTEPGDDDQPANAVESKAGDKEKMNPESEGRSQ